MGATAEEARSEHDVGDASLERFEEHVVLPWVVLEVGILDDDVLARDTGEGAAQRCSLAAIVLVGHDVKAWIAELGDEIGEDLGSAVGRSVVDHDDFGRPGRRQHPHDEGGDGVGLIEARHGDRQARAGTVHGIAANEP